MQSPLQAAINQLCSEKNLDKSIVLEAIENAVAIAYKKDFGTPGLEVKVHLGDTVDQIRIFEIREVVSKIEDYEHHILEKDAKLVRPDAEVGDNMFVPIELPAGIDFGRIAAQTAKHVMAQKLQEAERSMLFNKFKDREGELLTAQVQKADHNATLVEIEGVTTMLAEREKIQGEKFFTGQRIKVLLESVSTGTRGPQLRITRKTTAFIEALFDLEIPEMRDGLVEITRIVREPGVRCKIAVSSTDGSIDPVGAFVGQKGARINVIMEEVGEERIDVIQYYTDPQKMLLAALAPAKIIKTEFFESRPGEKRVKIFVREEDRAMVIGKKGQNVRLAGNLIEMQIDVVTYDGPIETEIEAPKAQKIEKREVSEKSTIDELAGIKPEVVTLLMELGLSQIKMFEGMSPEELAEVGIELADAESVIKAVKKYIG